MKKLFDEFGKDTDDLISWICAWLIVLLLVILAFAILVRVNDLPPEPVRWWLLI